MNLKLKKILWCFKKGFLPKEYYAYNLSCNDYSLYLPRYNNIKKASINGEFNHLLGNKILFEKHLKSITCDIEHLHVIENIGYIEKGHLMSLNENLNAGDYKSLTAFLEKSDLILKPIFGSRGRGILLLQKDEGTYLLDNDKITWDELISKLKTLDNYLIQERFVQKGFSNNIYPGSLNTMRVCTMVDPVTEKAFVSFAVHRFGSPESGYTDNFSQGGISAQIDSDGTLSRGLALNKQGEVTVFESHPLSKKPIQNEKIPNWKSITGSLIEMVRRMPYLKNIGWDVILSNGEIYILEGNIGADFDLIQVHKPLKEIPSAWKFLKQYNFV